MSQKTSLEGRTVTFAGKFKVARDTVKAEAEAAGCRITGAVSGSTDILVLGAGVEVWTEDQFRATLLSAVGGGGCGWGGGGGGKKGAGKRAADAGSKGPPAKKAKDRAVAGAAGAGTKVKKGHLREQLREAVESGNATEVRTLLVQGADMDTPGADGVTPAQEAASCNHCEVLKALIEAGDDVNKANKFNGYTPAHTAVTRNSMLALKALVDAGADMNAVDKCGRTPAHFAANLGRSDTLKLLIDAGADASKADKCGQTPAHFAANIGHSDTIKVLIDAGADMVKVDKDGKSPFDLAGFPQGPVSFRTAANAESRAKVLQLLRAHDSRQWWASP
jgi:ankyrin repeat protein